MPPEKELCSKCHAEPRVAGQRWGLNCRATAEAERRARVPRVSRGTVSRREQRRRLDDWLEKNRGLVEFGEPSVIVGRIREAQLFSDKTTAGDIRVSYQRRCQALGLPYIGGPSRRD